MLSVIGGLVGMAGAVAYGAADHARLANLVGRCGRDDRADAACRSGVADRRRRRGVLVAAMRAIWWSLRSLAPSPRRSLLMGSDPMTRGVVGSVPSHAAK